MFRAHVLIVRTKKLYYIVSGIITPIGRCPVYGAATPAGYLFLRINQLDALNIIISLFQASKCFEHMCSSSRGQKFYYTESRVLSQSVHGTATYRCDDTRDCIIQFCPPDDEHMCSKHVEA